MRRTKRTRDPAVLRVRRAVDELWDALDHFDSPAEKDQPQLRALAPYIDYVAVDYVGGFLDVIYDAQQHARANVINFSDAKKDKATEDEGGLNA